MRLIALRPLRFQVELKHHDWDVAIGMTCWPVRKSVRKAIYSRDNGVCYYCGSYKGLTIDHKVPQSAGGSNHSSNLVTACKSCNSSKGIKKLRDFIDHRFGGDAA